MNADSFDSHAETSLDNWTHLDHDRHLKHGVHA